MKKTLAIAIAGCLLGISAIIANATPPELTPIYVGPDKLLTDGAKKFVVVSSVQIPPAPPELPAPAPVETRALTVILPSAASVEPDYELVVLRGERVSGVTNWTEVARAKEGGQTNVFLVDVPTRSQSWFWAVREFDPLTGSNGPPSAAVSLRRPLLSEGVILQLK